MNGLMKFSFFWFVLAAFVLLALGLVITLWQWDWLRAGGSETASNADTLRNAGLMIGGLLALVFALWRGWVAEQQKATAQRQTDIAQQGFLNERYGRGAEMLGSEVLSVRLGGVYALRGLAEEYPELYHVRVMQIFCAFVRNPVDDSRIWTLSTIETEPPHGVPPLREDVQAIVDAIGSRTSDHLAIERGARFRLNLRASDLSGAMLIGANLSSADWESSAGQSQAGTLGISSFTDLANARLCSARLAHADLRKARIANACLCNASTPWTDMSEVDLAATNLHGTLSWGPILSGAKFSYDGGLPAKGIRQADLDSCWSAHDKLPLLSGVHDLETGAPLVWSGKPLDGGT